MVTSQIPCLNCFDSISWVLKYCVPSVEQQSISHVCSCLLQQWYTSTMNLIGTWLTDRMDLQLHLYQLKILIRIVKVTNAAWNVNTSSFKMQEVVILETQNFFLSKTFLEPWRKNSIFYILKKIQRRSENFNTWKKRKERRFKRLKNESATIEKWLNRTPILSPSVCPDTLQPFNFKYWTHYFNFTTL